MNEYIKKALDLFGDDVPSKDDFLKNIWVPYQHHVFGNDEKTLKAIFHYVNTYNDLKRDRIGDDYIALLCPENLALLPPQLDISVIHNMHNDLFDMLEKEHAEKTGLIAGREALVDSKIEHTKDLLKRLNADLENDDMHFSFSNDIGLDVLTIHDRVTDQDYEIVLQELNN